MYSQEARARTTASAPRWTGSHGSRTACNRTLVQVQFAAYRPVCLPVKMETQRLFDLVHFFTFSCHSLLNLISSCKVNKQVGGNAPKNTAPDSHANALFEVFSPFLGGDTPNNHWILSRDSGWWCSELSKPQKKAFQADILLKGGMFTNGLL